MTTDQINNMIFANLDNPEVVTDDIYDGCHTFGQLYFQRMMLFATLVNLFPEISWKTKRHEDGEECFGGGWFLVTIDTPEGAYGYHYKLEDWDKFNCMELYRAKHWDGYTEDNVDRLFSLVDYKKYMQREASERFGVLISNDWDTATAQMRDLNEAFKRGFETGVEICRERLKEVKVK